MKKRNLFAEIAEGFEAIAAWLEAAQAAGKTIPEATPPQAVNAG